MENKDVETEVEVNNEVVEELSLYDSLQTLQRKLEKTDDPKVIEALGKSIASINETMLNQENGAEKLGLLADELELKKAELEQQKAIQEKQIETQEKQIKVTKLAAILGIGGTLVTAGLKLVGVITQGNQAMEYMHGCYAEEKSDEPVVCNTNKRLIPGIFTKNQ